MKRNYFPASLNVSGRLCLVVGNDHEAIEKSERLQMAGANVVTVVPDKFRLTQIRNQFFVVFCPKDQPILAAAIFRKCRAKKILLCAIDQPQFCDVVNVSVFERGDLKIMISTNGVAPALAKKIRQGLEISLEKIPIEKFLVSLAKLRKKLEKEVVDVSLRRKKLIAAVESVKFSAKLDLPKSLNS